MGEHVSQQLYFVQSDILGRSFIYRTSKNIDMEIKQLGGKFVVIDGTPVAVWLMDEEGTLTLYQITEMQYSELEKLSENNTNV